MKNLIIAGFILLAASATFAQNRVNNDPTYSVNNYKQPNKAQYAAENNLGNSVSVETSKATVNENYKQSFNAGKTSQRAVSVSAPQGKSTRSYKHPYGL